MNDIASEAGVVRSTVSRALRNDPWIPRHTRSRIRALAEEMGYVPCLAARELAARRSWTIGVCLPDLGGRALVEGVRGLEGVARERGFTVLLQLCRGSESGEGDCLRDFQERRAAGIVVFRSSEEPGPLDSLRAPPVVISTCPTQEAEAAGRLAFERLARQIGIDP